MKKLLTILSVLFFSIGLNAQSQVIFNKTNQESYIIKYENGQQNFKNKIFKILAKGNSTNPANISVNFDLKQNRKILKHTNKLTLITKLTNTQISGHSNYKEFSVKKLLVPGNVSFRAILKNKNATIDDFTINNAAVSNGQSEILNINKTDSIGTNNYRLIIQNKNFKYTQQNFNVFKAYTDHIEAYYSANNMLRNKKRKLNSININKENLEQINDIQILRDYNNLSNSNLTYIREIKKKGFINALDLKNNDPKNVMSQIDRVKTLSATLNDITGEILDNLHIFYYNKGIDKINQNRYSEAKVFFEKSVQENNEFAPAHVQLAKILYNEGYRDDAIDKIYHVKKLNPDQETIYLNEELANGIYKDMLIEASGLNNHAAFDDAIFVLSLAEQLCRDFSTVRCLPNMDSELLIAIKGKYYIITDNANDALRKGRPLDSEELIDIAYNYRLDHLQFIPQKDEIVGLIFDLYGYYLDGADNLNNQNRFTDAIAELTKAERICNKYKEIQCDNRLKNGYNKSYNGIYNSNLQQASAAYNSKNYSLAETKINKAISTRKQFNLSKASNEGTLVLKIKKAIYNEYVAAGSSSMNSGNYKAALDNFNNAKNIENNYNIRPNSSLAGYITKAAKGLTLSYINSGKQKVNINNLSDARSYYNKAKNIANDYNIRESSEIKQEMNELKDMIFKQECINAQTKFDNYLHEAGTKINSGKYIEGNATINTAVKHANANHECEIDLADATKMQNDIADAVNYLNRINKALANIKHGNYSAGVIEYLQAGKVFTQNNVSRYSLIHKNLFDFFQSERSDFVNYGVHYYTKEVKYEKAILLLRTLNSRNYSRRDTKDNQYYLGGELAKRDFAQNPNSSWKTNVSRYTNNDKFFKYLSKSYKKQWKKLN